MTALDELVPHAMPAMLAGHVAKAPADTEVEFGFALGPEIGDLAGVVGRLTVLDELGDETVYESEFPVIRDEKPPWWRWMRRRRPLGQSVVATVPAGLPVGRYLWTMTLSDGEQVVLVFGPNSSLTIDPA